MIVADLPGPVSALLAGILPDVTPGDLVEIAIAGAVAAAVFALAWRWRKRPWPAALALAAGYTTGHVLIQNGLAGWSPPAAEEWLVHVALAAALLGCAGLGKRGRLWARLALSALVAWVLVGKVPTGTWGSSSSALYWTAALGGALFIWWSELDFRGRKLEGIAPQIALMLAAVGASLCLNLAHSALLAMLAAVVSAVLGAALAFGFVYKNFKLAPGGVGVAAPLLGALWIVGHFFADVQSHWSVLLLMGAAVPVFRRWWLTALVSAVLVALAVYLTYQANPPSSYDY